jgi:hypothetical protein
MRKASLKQIAARGKQANTESFSFKYWFFIPEKFQVVIAIA